MSDCWTARQQRQLSYIAEFTADIVHVPGTQNLVADLMSRPPQAVPVSGPATAAGVKVPSGSLAASQETGSTAGAPHHQAAAVTAVEGVDLRMMAREQAICPGIHYTAAAQQQVPAVTSFFTGPASTVV